MISGIRATTGVRQKAMESKSVLVQATNSGRIEATGIKPKAIAPTGAPIKKKRHPPANWRAQAVGPGANRRLNEQGSDIIQGHEKANDSRRKVKLIGQKQRNKAVVNAPDDADTKEAETEQEGLPVAEFYLSSLYLSANFTNCTNY